MEEETEQGGEEEREEGGGRGGKSRMCLTRHPRDDLGRRDAEERDAALVGNGISQGRLPASRGPVEEDSAGRQDPQPRVHLRQAQHSTAQSSRERVLRSGSRGGVQSMGRGGSGRGRWRIVA